MNFKEILQEMAAVHIDDQIGDLMIAGDVEKAVERYISNMEAKKATVAKASSATTRKLKEKRPPKSLKMDPEKLEKISPATWDKFDEIYKEKVSGGRKEGEKPVRKQAKGTSIQTRDGDEMIITSGQRQKVIKDDLARKVIALIKEREAELDVEEDQEKLADIASHLRALYILLEGLHISRSGKSVFKVDQEKIIARHKKIGAAYRKKHGIEEAQKDLDPEIKELIKQLEKLIEITKVSKTKMALNKTKDKFLKALYIKVPVKKSIKEDGFDYFLGSYNNLIENSRTSREEKAWKKEKDLFIKEAINQDFQKQNINISYNYKMEAIMEAENYKGRDFAENYVFSSFVKALRRDVDEYGIELTESIYTKIYGRNIIPLTSFIIENEEFFEALSNTRAPLLFEGYGMDENLTESVWNALKQFGGSSIGKLKGFLSSGAGWAKELMSKGISFFTTLPIAEIAIPAIALTGSVVGGVKLINKIRKEASKNPLSKEEREKFKQAVKEQRAEAKKYVD